MIVWELVRGEDLLEVVNKLVPNMLPEPRARRYFAQLLSGVKHIHANGFCHRDIKPENCMIDAATDTLKIIDFGMTKHLESAKTLMIGTPDYMAPELLTHNVAEVMGSGPSPEGEYDPRAVDVWSMGALLFICVAGVFPFENPRRPNDMIATLENVRNARYRELPPGTSPELQGAFYHLQLICGCVRAALTRACFGRPDSPHAAAHARCAHHAGGHQRPPVAAGPPRGCARAAVASAAAGGAAEEASRAGQAGCRAGQHARVAEQRRGRRRRAAGLRLHAARPLQAAVLPPRGRAGLAAPGAQVAALDGAEPGRCRRQVSCR